MTVKLRTTEEVRAYYRLRRMFQAFGLGVAISDLVLALLVAVTGGPWWVVAGFVAAAAWSGLFAAGWVPKWVRPETP